MVCILPDPPGCGHGFMSVETMRFLLLPIPNIGHTSQRQQISPEMRFTCDGMITKWIVGAEFDSRDNLYPELQIWRNTGDTKYEKINGTLIEFQTSSPSKVYEYEDFPPIPVKSGDILGIFLPRDRDSRLRLRSESSSSPTQYFLTTGATSSSHDEIDIQDNSVQIEAYHPLVTVEFGMCVVITFLYYYDQKYCFSLSENPHSPNLIR